MQLAATYSKRVPHKFHRNFTDQKVGDLSSNLSFAAKNVPDHPNLPRAHFLTSATEPILRLTNMPHYVSQKRLTCALALLAPRCSDVDDMLLLPDLFCKLVNDALRKVA